MIETLNGTKETVNYSGDSMIRLYDNVEEENYPLHWHTSYEIIMPIDNIYSVYCHNTTYILQVGDILIISSGILHQITSPDSGRRYIILADLYPLNSLYEFNSLAAILPSVVHITPENSSNIHGSLQRLIYDIVDEYKSEAPYRDMVIYSKLISVFAFIGRNYATENTFPGVDSSKQFEYSKILLSVCNYIHNHFNDNITLDQMADLAGFSKYHFSRIFKQYTNITFYQYLNRKRIMHAATLLMDPDLSVNEVSQQSGFTSISAFIRMFKIQKSCTPSEFKEMHLQRRETNKNL